MSKTITAFTAQLVTFETSLHYTEVIRRLDIVVNKQQSADILSQIRNAKTKAEIEHIVNTAKGAHTFLYFVEYPHHKWLNTYLGVDHPVTITYTIGNPLVAQTILKHDLRAAYNIPPRLLVLEKEDRNGTSVMYHLPSSVMALSNNPQLKEAVEALDAKLEEMVSMITSTDSEL